MKGLFITGTDTDAGKTTVTAALLRALKVAGVPAAAVKPVQTGCVMRGEEEEEDTPNEAPTPPMPAFPQPFRCSGVLEPPFPQQPQAQSSFRVCKESPSPPAEKAPS